MRNIITKYFAICTLSSVVALSILAPLGQTANAQSSYHVGGKSTLTLNGTSTLHDWNMVAHTFATTAQISLSGGNELNTITVLNLVLPVHNLRSDHNGMNDNAYEALKADQFKDIIFKLTSAKITSTTGSKYQIAAAGNLSIAGVTRPITLITTAVVNADGSVSCSGTVPIKLSEFKIERPSFMLGTMKVGDAMTLNIALVLVK